MGKKAAGVLPGGVGSFYRPEDTRPLSIVNTDSRILARAVRIRVEPVLNRWVSLDQRGFLRGRSMLANVLDVELFSRLAGYQCRRAIMIFFDF